MAEKKILIVDDEDGILAVLQASLRKLGPDYQITTRSDGRSALDLLEQHPFDLVITDYRMAGMDGLQLIEQIGRLQPETRVILITAYGSESLEWEAKRLNAYRCLSKPLEINKFREIVKEAADLDASPQSNMYLIADSRYRQLCDLLEELKNNVEARCAVLTNVNGQIIAKTGNDTNLPISQISSLMGGGIAALFEAGSVLGEIDAPTNLAYMEGKWENLYTVNVGKYLLLTLIIGKGSINSRLGTVWYYVQQTVTNLRKTLGSINALNLTPQLEEEARQSLQMGLEKLIDSDIDDLFIKEA